MKVVKSAFFSFLVCGIFSARGFASEPVSFFDSVARMVERSPKFGAARELLEAQRELAKPGLFAHFPEVSATASRGVSGAFESGSQNTQSATVGASLALPLFRFGADEAAVEQSRIALVAVDVDVLAARVQAEKDMASLVLDTVKWENQNILEERIFRSRAETLAKAETLFARGLLPAEELDKMRLDVGLAKVALVDGKTRAAEFRRLAEAAYGGPLGVVRWPWDFVFFKRFETWDANATLRKTLASATRSASLNVEKAERELVVARGGMLPSFSAGASVQKTYAIDSDVPSNPAAWSVGFSASIPIFARLQNVSRLDAAARSFQAARLKREETERAVGDEVLGLAAKLRDLVAATRERELFLRQGQKNLARSRERFLSGKISSNDLAMDETRVFQMEQTLIAGQADLHQSLLQLCSVLQLSLSKCSEKI